ncbi:MAG: 2-succinyl-5-enolpyruvyl-6-hydroxy-3-cyclohexene-1-carboxylic-acid synthase, partial [Micrococcus sp.]|nr:2-succinyl-5-enolpyruvyl-6-hydroxy-3-cyclohexene-1-carboxylic-acid synthase [Micrococcus sp.]
MTSAQTAPRAADSLAVARTVLDALIEAGMRDAVVCPGSRSAPLAYELAAAERAGRVRVHVRIDERTAGFLAHGLSLGSGRPVGVVTTSGSAAGNLLPALMESWHAGTRVIALTADRPAALHGTGANQTTRQTALFPHHVRFAASIATLPAEADNAPSAEAVGAHLDAITSTVARAAMAAEGFISRETAAGVEVVPAPSGPVHLNLEFTEPLVPDAAARVRIAGQQPPAPGTVPVTGPASVLDAHPTTGALPDLSSHLVTTRRAAPVPTWRPPGVDLSGFPPLDLTELDHRRTLVVAAHDAGPVAAAFALALGLPLFAEPSSNSRFTVNAVAAYPLLLGSHGGLGEDSHPAAAQIERIVLFGRPTLSRPIAALLAREDIETAIYAPEPVSWYESGMRREQELTTLDAVAAFAGQGALGWVHTWQVASRRAQAAVEDVLVGAHATELTPQDVARWTAAAVRGPLLLGSSSAIRDVDLAWGPPATPHSQVYANRGLAGIDGNISTAAGIALATQRRTVALLGDLTALHDIGGLLVPEGESDPSVDILVVNDAGGAIFAALEHGEVARAPGMGDVVERLFGTPHSVSFSALARAYGIPYRSVESTVGLHTLLSEPVRGRRIIEVHCQRSARAAVAQRLREAVRATL